MHRSEVFDWSVEKKQIKTKNKKQTKNKRVKKTNPKQTNKRRRKKENTRNRTGCMLFYDTGFCL